MRLDPNVKLTPSSRSGMNSPYHLVRVRLLCKYISSFSSEGAVKEAEKYEKCVIDYRGYPRCDSRVWGWSSIPSERKKALTVITVFSKLGLKLHAEPLDRTIFKS